MVATTEVEIVPVMRKNTGKSYFTKIQVIMRFMLLSRPRTSWVLTY